jgi:hypothetical protein
MPYSICKVPGGFKVKSESGTLLSHKPLTLANAKKQKIAATLSSLRRRGMLRGGGGNEGYSLSDTDIQQILGGTNVIKYPELHSMNSIEEAFDDKGRCMMLYLTTDDSTGHWTCLIKDDTLKTIEFFDPYGGIPPDGERKWLPKAKQVELGQDKPLLTEMIRGAGYKVLSNPYHFQKEGGGVNTCGRHCCARLLLSHIPLKKYKQMIDDSGVSPDEFVTEFTSQVIHK